jgi:hypothetical protein
VPLKPRNPRLRLRSGSVPKPAPKMPAGQRTNPVLFLRAARSRNAPIKSRSMSAPENRRFAAALVLSHRRSTVSRGRREGDRRN